MKDNLFWQLADKYEKIDENDQPFVPSESVTDLAEEILNTNKWDYDESLADFNLFRFDNQEKALQIFKNVYDKWHNMSYVK